MALADYRCALVTGASSGIGAATVRALRAGGLEVHAAARRADRLDALAAETGCIPHPLDVVDTPAVYRLVEGIEVDVLVNNAGLGRGFGAFPTVAPEDIDTTIDTNVKAAIHVLRAALPGMVARGRGHVVNIGSVAGLYPIGPSIYGASKGAIHLLGRNLRIELAGSGVRLTEINPGRVSTEFFAAAIDDADTLARTTDTGIEVLRPEDIADAIVYAVDAPWRVNVSLVELQPTEQVFGGLRFVPASRARGER